MTPTPPIERTGTANSAVPSAHWHQRWADKESIDPMKTVRTESPVDVEQLIVRGQVRGALATVVMLALVGATSCTTKPFVTKSERNDSAIGRPARLGFVTVRSILEDSKG